jgi:DNA-binding transcriptional LysR family regulator
MKYPDLNLLYALDCLLRCGSVKAAASEMNLSAPAMSHTLARLRIATGDQVFVRAGRQLVPTARALEMLSAARDITELGRVLLSRQGDDRSWTTQARQFVVIAPDSLVVVLGARLLEALCQKIPKATLTLLPDSLDGHERLRSAAVDLEIRNEARMASELRTERLYSQPFIAALRAQHPLASRPLTLKRYVTGHHVCMATASEPVSALDAVLAKAGAVREVRLRVSTPYAALFAASRSDLIATVPAGLAQTVAKGLGLECKPLPVKVENLSVVQAWHPRLDLEPAHQHLRACIRQLLGSQQKA